ncbi:MAG: Protein/nucleic acid deglycase 3 [Eubacteriales bacterium SKADARSKE-1]|nr:Protein/nucleic acid deglycase 3 [Eubacteriales bacterium SKADARSKE-1]
MIYVFLANGFEEIEAVTTIDVLRRAGYDVRTVGIDNKFIVGANKIKLEADAREEEINLSQTQAIVLPGGMPGALNLKNSATVLNAINYCVKNQKIIAAICAAPLVLGEVGILNGKNAVCYPGFENKLTGANILNQSVCVDKNIITAKGPGVALSFALRLVEMLSDKTKSDKIKDVMQCL